MARLTACPAFHLLNRCLPPDRVLCVRATVPVLVELGSLLRTSPVLVPVRSAIVVSRILDSLVVCLPMGVAHSPVFLRHA